MYTYEHASRYKNIHILFIFVDYLFYICCILMCILNLYGKVK